MTGRVTVEIRPANHEDLWIPCASIQLAAEAISVAPERLYRTLAPSNGHTFGDELELNGFIVRRARRVTTECTSGKPDCYCLSGRGRSVVRVDSITGELLE